jgi:hypothetical protein
MVVKKFIWPLRVRWGFALRYFHLALKIFTLVEFAGMAQGWAAKSNYEAAEMLFSIFPWKKVEIVVRVP